MSPRTHLLPTHTSQASFAPAHPVARVALREPAASISGSHKRIQRRSADAPLSPDQSQYLHTHISAPGADPSARARAAPRQSAASQAHGEHATWASRLRKSVQKDKYKQRHKRQAVVVAAPQQMRTAPATDNSTRAQAHRGRSPGAADLGHTVALCAAGQHSSPFCGLSKEQRDSPLLTAEQTQVTIGAPDELGRPLLPAPIQLAESDAGNEGAGEGVAEINDDADVKEEEEVKAKAKAEANAVGKSSKTPASTVDWPPLGHASPVTVAMEVYTDADSDTSLTLGGQAKESPNAHLVVDDAEDSRDEQRIKLGQPDFDEAAAEDPAAALAYTPKSPVRKIGWSNSMSTAPTSGTSSPHILPDTNAASHHSTAVLIPPPRGRGGVAFHFGSLDLDPKPELILPAFTSLALSPASHATKCPQYASEITRAASDKATEVSAAQPRLQPGSEAETIFESTPVTVPVPETEPMHLTHTSDEQCGVLPEKIAHQAPNKATAFPPAATASVPAPVYAPAAADTESAGGYPSNTPPPGAQIPYPAGAAAASPRLGLLIGDSTPPYLAGGADHVTAGAPIPYPGMLPFYPLPYGPPPPPCFRPGYIPYPQVPAGTAEAKTSSPAFAPIQVHSYPLSPPPPPPPPQLHPSLAYAYPDVVQASPRSNGPQLVAQGIPPAPHAGCLVPSRPCESRPEYTCPFGPTGRDPYSMSSAPPPPGLRLYPPPGVPMGMLPTLHGPPVPHWAPANHRLVPHGHGQSIPSEGPGILLGPLPPTIAMTGLPAPIAVPYPHPLPPGLLNTVPPEGRLHGQAIRPY